MIITPVSAGVVGMAQQRAVLPKVQAPPTTMAVTFAAVAISGAAVAVAIGLGVTLTAVSLTPGVGRYFQVTPPGTWRSDMFPAGWRPVDEGVIMGTNVINDSAGTRDENGNPVTAGPNYHPYRFLHDFSYAGYQRGERPIPPEDPSPTVWTKTVGVYNVVNSPYNCVPNGTMDCRSAIQNAIDDVGPGGGVVYLPAGEYRIRLTRGSNAINIRKSRVVLRGDGSGRTRLKIDPDWSDASFQMPSSGVIHVEPVGESTYGWSIVSNQRTITRNEPFPTKKIRVSSVAGFTVSDTIPIMIQGEMTTSYITEHDMRDDAGNYAWPLGEKAYLWRRKIVELDPVTNEITLDVPTRYRIKTTDNPFVAVTRPGIVEIGVEGLSLGMIRHPDDWPDNSGTLPSAPIVTAINENYAITYFNVINGWIADVNSYRPTENANRPQRNDLADNYGDYDIELLNGAVRMKHAQFITVKNFHFQNSQSNTVGCCGIGYTAQLENTNEVLFERGTFQKMKKAFTINLGGASGNVFKDMTIKEIFLTPSDFHAHLSTANLIENIFFDGNFWEAAMRPLGAAQGSSTDHGQSSTQNVFWNVSGSPLTISAREYDADRAGTDPGIVISSQYGWGYIIGTYGSFSTVVTPVKPHRRYSGETWRPYILPRDYTEGIGYDRSVDPRYAGKTLYPRSLYEAQLALRLGTGCTPIWSCTAWAPNPCTTGTQTRTCTDANACGSPTGKPPESQTCLPTACVENWSCTPWSPAPCASGSTQTRTCTDANTCGTAATKPAESQTCPVVPPPPPATKLKSWCELT